MSDVPFGVWLGREVSARTLLFHGAVAEWMGLNPTDYKVLDILHRAGRMTAGEIAAETGLSTGAVTGVVDRLERGRWAERVKDPDDRRKVVVVPVVDEARDRRVEEIFAPLAREMEALLATFDSRELAALERYFRRTVEVLTEETARVRKLPPVGS